MQSRVNQYDTVSVSKKELYNLLEDKELEKKPILIVANKIDVNPHMTAQEIIREMNLDYIYSNPWSVLSISALNGQNVEEVVEWLNEQGK